MLCFSESRVNARAAARVPVSTLVIALLLSGCGSSSSGHPARTQHQATVKAVAVALTARHSQRARRSTPRHHSAKPHARHTRPTPQPKATQSSSSHVSQSPQTQQATQAQNKKPSQPKPRPQQHVVTHRTPTPVPSPASVALATFKKDFLPAVTPLKQSSQAIGAALRQAPSETGAQILTAFRDLTGRWLSQLDKLQTLKPPPNLAGDFNALTSAGNRVESDLKAIVAAVEAQNKAAGGQAVRSVVTDIIAARSADAALEQKLAAK